MTKYPSSAMEYCSTCTTPIHGLSAPMHSSEAADTPPIEHRRVNCCSRIICARCIQKNQRFATYCPYCQISSAPSSLPQGLNNDPPLYSSLPNSRSRTVGSSSLPPPPYEADASSTAPPPHRRSHDGTFIPKDINDEKSAAADDTLHFLNHEHDTVHSLSLRYNVPAEALRRRNHITSDHLLQGRKTILIPGEYYNGGSLSPRPVEGEDEELKRGKIRRFMSTCKVADYDVALVYLEQVSYDLDAAMEAYWDDDAWEREHPFDKERRQQQVRKRNFFWPWR